MLGAGSKQRRRKQSANRPQALAGTSFGRAVPEPDGASRQVLRQRTFPARFCVLSRKCLSGGFVQPGTHFSTTEAALPRRTPVRFADWIEPKQGERRRVAGRLDTESPSLRDLGLPVLKQRQKGVIPSVEDQHLFIIALDNSSTYQADFTRARRRPCSGRPLPLCHLLWSRLSVGCIAGNFGSMGRSTDPN